MNPFENDIFKFFWDNDTVYNTNRRKEVLEENDPPTIEQTVDFVADAEDSKELINKLYFIFRSEIPDYIGWFKNPTHENGIGGYLPIEFYEKLYNKTPFKSDLFPLMPGESQTDEMLKEYLENGKEPKISNFHKDELSDEILNLISLRYINQINFFKEEWWTPKAKKIILKSTPFAITFIPENLLTDQELIDYLDNEGERQKGFMKQFWDKIPKSFKHNPKIFGKWLSLIDGGLVSQYKNLYNEPYYTLEGIKEYFNNSKAVPFHTWRHLKPAWKEDLIDIAIPKVYGAIAVDKDIELTNDILEKTLKYPAGDSVKTQIAVRLQKEGRLTPELIEKLKLSYWNIDNLAKDQRNKLLNNEDVLDYIVIKKQDEEFLRRQSNWPKNAKIKKEYIIPIMRAVNFSFSKIKSRLGLILSDEDVYIWVFFEALKNSHKKDIRTTLKQLTKNEIHISKEIIELLDSLSNEKNMTFDKFKATKDIFFF